MRAHAAGLLCVVAAVELLIEHGVWLRRDDFVAEFVCVEHDSSGQVALVWVDWPAASAGLDAGRLPCAGSEAGVLRVAASLAEGVPVDLGAAVTGLDEINLGVVVAAVARASGRGAAALWLRGRERS